MAKVNKEENKCACCGETHAKLYILGSDFLCERCRAVVVNFIKKDIAKKMESLNMSNN